MKHLQLPASANEDKEAIEKLCAKPEWAPHRQAWLSAYDSYGAGQGDPWLVSPTPFMPDISVKQRALYDSRKSIKPLLAIRRTGGLLSCPVCGSPTTGHLDHYLPKTTYPEFSIMQANLVPACNHCNSGGKRALYKGDQHPERFIQPYFDAWADQVLWHVVFVPPFEAVRFQPTPRAGLPADKAAIVQFHLEHVLGDQFQRSLATKWSTLPAVLAKRINKPNPTPEEIEQQLGTELDIAKESLGVNSWDTAFFRGLLMDIQAIDHLHSQIQ